MALFVEFAMSLKWIWKSTFEHTQASILVEGLETPTNTPAWRTTNVRTSLGAQEQFLN